MLSHQCQLYHSTTRLPFRLVMLTIKLMISGVEKKKNQHLVNIENPGDGLLCNGSIVGSLSIGRKPDLSPF